jgi:putative oligomerization/nucleic acid binding protein
VLDDLERLADLRDRGAVTEEEFQRKKRDLLDRL